MNPEMPATWKSERHRTANCAWTPLGLAQYRASVAVAGGLGSRVWGLGFRGLVSGFKN